MAGSEFIGVMDCPICGNHEATVHKQQRGTKKGRLYYRCYTSPGGATMRCGTIQCLGPEGQEVIKRLIRPIGQPEPEKELEPVQGSEDFVPGEPIGQPESEIEEKRESEGGLLNWLLTD